jgi:hypothetical protein
MMIVLLLFLQKQSLEMHGEFLRLLFSTGPPGDQSALHCSWNAINNPINLNHFPSSARHSIKA